MADESFADTLERLVITPERNQDNTARMNSYHEALFSPAGETALRYLTDERGLAEGTIRAFKLGFVADPHPIDRMAQGFISIPYLTPSGVFDIRFRRGPGNPETAPKYWQPAGSTQTIFNVRALDPHSPYVVIGEGEFTAIMAMQVGIPCIAYPGVESVKPFHRHLLEGFERVYLCGDGDDAGANFNRKLAEMIPNAYPITLPPGEDIDSLVRTKGEKALRDLLFGK